MVLFGVVRRRRAWRRNHRCEQGRELRTHDGRDL